MKTPIVLVVTTLVAAIVLTASFLLVSSARGIDAPPEQPAAFDAPRHYL